MGALMETAPLASERFQDALPLIPGVVRGPDGLLNINGTRSNQSALMFNNADGTYQFSPTYGFAEQVTADVRAGRARRCSSGCPFRCGLRRG